MLGLALIALAFHAMLSAVVLVASLVLLQMNITPDLPWISSVQQDLYMRATRSIWQNQANCVVFDDELIYKPKIGTCQFNNPEFKTTLNFSAEGRFTGGKPAGPGIAVIGDSHAMGWGVQDEETFAAGLQKLSGRPVYNLAVSSYGTVREVLRLEKSGLLDKVDTIVIQYCNNDLPENRRGQITGIDENRKKFEKITQGEKSFSGLLRMIRKTYSFAFSFPFKRMKTKAAKPPEDFSPHYAPLMAVLASHASLKNKRVLIFYSNGNRRQFRAFPTGRDKLLPNVEFIDMSLDAGDFYRLDDHLTAAGHRKVAEGILRAIRQ
ncbi:MAG: SGNH/GDSL hydrolase family protein [Betaproteobacteria bacterium]|nr:SGNH/GDSL hydrolase family protein [Betaproteobacteria bacterium]